MSDDIKDIATEISKHKYRALIPDIYKGKVGVEKEEAKHVCTLSMCTLLDCNCCKEAMYTASHKHTHALLVQSNLTVFTYNGQLEHS